MGSGGWWTQQGNSQSGGEDAGGREGLVHGVARGTFRAAGKHAQSGALEAGLTTDGRPSLHVKGTHLTPTMPCV